MKAGQKAPTALVFDAYGTLFDVYSVMAALEERFPGHGSAISKEWRSRQLEYTWLRSLMGRYEDFWVITEAALVATCNEMKLHLDARVRSGLMEAYLRLDLFPEVKRALETLAGWPLAILSNGTPRMLQSVVDAAGLQGVFSHVISVDEVKTYKPSPAAYQLAVTQMGLDKASIGFVSSNYWDVAGAKCFGFKGYWVNRSGAVRDELGVTPDATLKSLSDMANLLNA